MLHLQLINLSLFDPRSISFHLIKINSQVNTKETTTAKPRPNSDSYCINNIFDMSRTLHKINSHYSHLMSKLTLIQVLKANQHQTQMKPQLPNKDRIVTHTFKVAYSHHVAPTINQSLTIRPSFHFFPFLQDLFSIKSN